MLAFGIPLPVCPPICPNPCPPSCERSRGPAHSGKTKPKKSVMPPR
jgi:hypothetical protein